MPKSRLNGLENLIPSIPINMGAVANLKFGEAVVDIRHSILNYYQIEPKTTSRQVQILSASSNMGLSLKETKSRSALKHESQMQV